MGSRHTHTKRRFGQMKHAKLLAERMNGRAIWSLSLHCQLLQHLNNLVHALRDLSRLKLPRIALSTSHASESVKYQRFMS